VTRELWFTSWMTTRPRGKDLKQMVEGGKFRSDLYYRLNVFPLTVPPLRERRQDIGLLIRFFTQRYAKKLNRAIEEIPVNVLEALTRYDWPGNIRELQNVIERSVILSKGPELCVAMPEFQVESAPLELPGRALNISKDERDHILQALKEAGGVISGPNGAAARLGLRRTTLQSRRQKYNIARQYQ
jgi:formate hydrogenlyase transcriptional activator